MAGFFVEFRFHGDAKRRLKRLVRIVARKYHVAGAVKGRLVPHMALFYGMSTPFNPKKIRESIENIAKQWQLVSFKINGFDWKDGEQGKVIAARITPSNELRQLRQSLAEELSKTTTLHSYDKDPDFWFHSTIAFQDIDQKFDRIWDYLNTNEGLALNEQHLTRITVLNERRKIVGEYDLLLKRWLNRSQVVTPGLREYWYRKTVNRLKELRHSQRPSMWERIYKLLRVFKHKQTVYVIGDTHFDHEKVIRYCRRPFRNIEEMNETMMMNWNNTVDPQDTVYFLGDLAFGKGSKPASYWLNKLNGHIILLRGSHDQDKRLKTMDFCELKVRDKKILLIHNPDPRDPHQTKTQKEKLDNWHDWIIHGHKHNNDLTNYPFINGDRKTINVSVELINYRPLDINKIFLMRLGSIQKLEFLPPDLKGE